MIRIYKITDRTNNKIYIGQTKQDIYKRFGDHLSRVNSNRKNDRACTLYIAMNNHGRENFYVELIEELEDNKLIGDQREIYWISFYDATNPDKGYNIDKGGHTISESCRKARLALQIGKPVLERVAKLNRERGMKIAKPVCQYTKDGKLISEFPSIIEASRKTGCDRRSIQRQVNGISNIGTPHSFGNLKFIWKYKN